MAGELQRVFQRRKDLFKTADDYGTRGSRSGDEDEPTTEEYERELERLATRLVLAKLELLLLPGRK